MVLFSLNWILKQNSEVLYSILCVYCHKSFTNDRCFTKTEGLSSNLSQPYAAIEFKRQKQQNTELLKTNPQLLTADEVIFIPFLQMDVGFSSHLFTILNNIYQYHLWLWSTARWRENITDKYIFTIVTINLLQ